MKKTKVNIELPKGNKKSLIVTYENLESVLEIILDGILYDIDYNKFNKNKPMTFNIILESPSSDETKNS